MPQNISPAPSPQNGARGGSNLRVGANIAAGLAGTTALLLAAMVAGAQGWDGLFAPILGAVIVFAGASFGAHVLARRADAPTRDPDPEENP